MVGPPESSTILAAVISVVLGGGVSYTVAKLTERHKGQFAASQAEIVARAEFVRDLQKRVGELQEALNAAWRREQEAADHHRANMAEAERLNREAFARYRQDLDALDHRWRHLAAALLQHIVIIRRRLRAHGEDAPEFVGLDEFEREGGSVREEWVIALKQDQD